MAIFGGMMKKPMFGQIPGLDMMQDAVKPPMQMSNPLIPMHQPMEQKNPGFFSKGGGWIDALGAFGDAFSGNGPVYANQKMQRSRMMQEQEMADQKRQQDRENFLFEENYKRQNPMPVNNDTTADYDYIASKLGKDAADNYLRLKTERQQTTIIDNGDGTKTIYQVPQGGGMPSGAPTAPVGRLRPLGGQPGGNSPFVQ